MKFLLQIFVFFVQLAFIFCEFDYCSLNDNVCENVKHIACDTSDSNLELIKDQPNIKKEELSEDDKISLLNYINLQRNQVALGRTLLPKGANLEKTIWDDELEFIAKSLAGIQSFGSDEFCFKRSNGEQLYSNILAHRINPRTKDEAIEEVLTNTNNDIEKQNSTLGLKEFSFLSKIGCYFGYAASPSGDNYYGGLSCIVDYGMNHRATHEMYIEGEPCTICKSNAGCDSTYTGLCATT